jgi:hypothetical protein
MSRCMEERAGENGSEPSDLSADSRQPSDLPEVHKP